MSGRPLAGACCIWEQDLTSAGELRIANARIVLADRVIERGAVSIVGGLIEEVREGGGLARGALDLGGDLLIPGLVELHTDNLEAHVMPRSGVFWNIEAAVLAYDAQMVAAGVTTVLNSLRCGTYVPDDPVADRAPQLGDALAAAEAAGTLRADHLVHLRCELTAPETADVTARMLAQRPVRLISLMDHTPGERQERDIERSKGYFRRRGMSEAEIDALINGRIARANANRETQRRAVIALARQHGVVLASHDDATPQHVAELIADGVRIAEFPTTVEAAVASHEAGIRVLMGSPNLVRGGSHAGNVAAGDLARRGVLDILSSDYIPSSLLVGIAMLAESEPAFDLPRAVGLATRHPAEAVGLTDRGEIAVGKRADLVRLSALVPTPVVGTVWRGGVRVL